MQTKHSLSQDTTQPLVSFIITCYDLPIQMICQCIDSILALTLRPFEREIIVVDDGSPNAFINQLNNYVDDITYVRKSNGGVSTARNMGLSMTTGKFIQFIDGDDYLVRPGYEHVLDLARYGHYDLIMFDFDSSEETTIQYEDSQEMSGQSMLRRMNIHGSACTYLFRKTIVGNLQFTKGIFYGEDEEFVPQLLLRADMAIQTTAKAYFYRQRSTSVIHNRSDRALVKRLNDMKTVISKLHKLSDTLPTDDRLALERRVHQLTMDYIYNIIVLTGRRTYLDHRLQELSRIGLYPLPDRNYTQKYSWFRRLANTKVGLSLLMKTLPLMKKER